MTYPNTIDNDSTLYLVHDFLRLRLAEDYAPGGTSVSVEADADFDKFPDSGIITLTEQCSDVDERAISFFYSGKGDYTFTGLELMSGFTDSAKPKRVTNVTMNVMSQHREALKNALIAIEGFVGTKGEEASEPLQGTVEARVNFLRNLVLAPRAWFGANGRVGVVPLCINFEDFSTREPGYWNWSFGDGTSMSVSRSGLVSSGDVTKCFYTPGVYSISLSVTNDFGTNTVVIPDYVTARVAAPNAATISFTPSSYQILSSGVLRTRVDRPISIFVTSSGQQPLDTIEKYIWTLEDDMLHAEDSTTTASYGVGGVYDVKLRTETELGAFRTTKFENVIDVVERYNVWHFIFDATAAADAVTKTLYCYEFGTVSEVYKTASPATTSVTRNYNFLTGKDGYSQQYREFRRNNGFAKRSLTSSGDAGTALIFWAEGAALDTSSQDIKFLDFDGFNGVYTSVTGFSRYWNWVALASSDNLHFVMGNPNPYPMDTLSPTSLVHDAMALSDLSVTSTNFDTDNFLNGATELMNNVDDGAEGDFSVYRGAWKDSDGYIVRNDGFGAFFRIKSFYRTENVGTDELVNIRKLTDIPGNTKFEGQLVSLTDGVYFFNNTGEVAAYDPVGNVWATGGPGFNSPSFASLQDTAVNDYDDQSNTLIAASDGDRNAYLFFDYSVNAAVSFNEVDKTFRTLPPRPSAGEQFLAGVF